MKSALIIAAFLVLGAVAVRFTAAPPWNVTGSFVARHVADVALISDSGYAVRLDRPPRGALIVLGYTRCADACPLALAKASAAARGLRGNARPGLFFVTIDPAFDSRAVLRRYLAAWDHSIVGITGEPDALRRVAASLGAAGGARPAAEHDTRLFLIDPAGDVVEDIPPDIAVGDLRRLLATAAPPH
ncbi:MAG: SCO family protein [Candidatus Velthaea sp.]